MNTHTRCTKCDSPDLFAVPATPSDHSHIVVGGRLMRNVGVYRYVCTDCGYIEEWVNDQVDLGSLKQDLLRERASVAPTLL